MKHIITLILLVAAGLSYGNKPVVKSLSNSVVVITPPKTQLHTLGWPNDIINSIAIKTEDGIVLVDTQNSPANAQIIKDEVMRLLGDDRFAYIINTHGHSCHSGGNCVFDANRIVAQVNSLEDIKNYDDIFLGQTVDYLRKKIYYKTNILDTITSEGVLSDSLNQAIDLYKQYENDLINNYKARYPDITFEDKLILNAGNTTIELVYMGKGHSNGDLAVYIREENLLCTGNLFHLGSFKEAGMPNFYNNRPNEVYKWIESMDYLLNEDHPFTDIVTTHGKKPLKRSNLEFVNDYCKALSELISNAKKNNSSMESIQDIEKMKSVFNQYRSVVHLSKEVEEIHVRNVSILWKFVN